MNRAATILNRPRAPSLADNTKRSAKYWFESTAAHLPEADRWIAQEEGPLRIAILAPLVEPVPEATVN
jgi:hypothetical protein